MKIQNLMGITVKRIVILIFRALLQGFKGSCAILLFCGKFFLSFADWNS